MKFYKSLLFSLLMSLLFYSFPVFSQYQYAQDYPCVFRLNAYGGSFSTLAFDPSNPEVLYTAGYGGILYKSTDGGATWRQWHNYGLPKYHRIFAIAVDPVNPDVLYVSLEWKGIYKTTDGGLNWSIIFQVPTGEYVPHKIVIDPTNTQIVYFIINSSTYRGVYKSTDGGSTWQAKNNGLDSLEVVDIVIDPNNSNVLFVTIDGSHKIYRSTDGGETWSPSDSGIPSDSHLGYIEINPSNSSILYTHSLRDVYKSIDGGANWFPLYVTEVVTALTFITDISINPSNPDVLYAGTDDYWIISSNDGGDTWYTLNPLLSKYFSIDYIVSAPPSTLYAITTLTSGYIFKSTDGGNSWVIANDGIREATGLDVEVTSNPDIIYSVGGGIFLKSVDGGKTWNPVKTMDIRDSTEMISVESSPVDPNVVFMGTKGFPIDMPPLHKSTDGGNTWVPKERKGGTDGFMPWAITFDPTNPSIMYSGGDGTIYKSTDYGETWTMVRFGDGSDVTDIVVNFINPQIVYFSYGNVCNPETGVWKSTDGGNTWFQSSSGLPISTEGGYCTIRDLEMDPVNPDIIYAAISASGYCDCVGIWCPCWGVYKSTDGGATWKRAGKNMDGLYPEIFSVKVDPANPNTVYAGGERGIYVSYNGGSTWKYIPNGSENYDETFSIALTNTTPQVLFAGNKYEGIFKVVIPPSLGQRPITYCSCPGEARVWPIYPENSAYAYTFFLDGTHFTLLADYLCGNPKDFDRVLFQYRPYHLDYAPPTGDLPDIPWQDIPSSSSHPNPDYTYPYFVHLDLTKLANWTTYEFRAIAYTKDGKEDWWVWRSQFFVDHEGPQDEMQYLNGEGELEVKKVFWRTENNKLLAGHPSRDLYDEFLLSGSALPADDTITYIMETPSQHESKVDKTRYKSIGEFRSISFSSGLTSFINGQVGTLRIGYPDSDQDGKVDGTNILETSLKVYRYLSGTNWEEIPSRVLTDTNQVEVKISHLSLFAIFAPPSGRRGAIISCKNCSLSGSNGISSSIPLIIFLFYTGYMRIKYRRR